MLLLLFIASFVVAGMSSAVIMMSSAINNRRDFFEKGTCLVCNLRITFKYIGYNTRQGKGGWGGGGVQVLQNDHYQYAMCHEWIV